jgi:hypothetical protein
MDLLYQSHRVHTRKPVDSRGSLSNSHTKAIRFARRSDTTLWASHIQAVGFYSTCMPNYTWVFNPWFVGRPDIVDLAGVWAAPAAPKTIPEGGGLRPVTFWNSFLGRRGRPDTPNINDFRPAQKPCVKNQLDARRVPKANPFDFYAAAIRVPVGKQQGSLGLPDRRHEVLQYSNTAAV